MIFIIINDCEGKGRMNFEFFFTETVKMYLDSAKEGWILAKEQHINNHTPRPRACLLPSSTLIHMFLKHHCIGTSRAPLQVFLAHPPHTSAPAAATSSAQAPTTFPKCNLTTLPLGLCFLSQDFSESDHHSGVLHLVGSIVNAYGVSTGHWGMEDNG